MLGRLSIEDIKDSAIRQYAPFKPGDIVIDIDDNKIYEVKDCIWSHLYGWEVVSEKWNHDPSSLIKVANGKETT